MSEHYGPEGIEITFDADDREIVVVRGMVGAMLTNTLTDAVETGVVRNADDESIYLTDRQADWLRAVVAEREEYNVG